MLLRQRFSFLLLATLALALPASAKTIFKCQAPDGTIFIQDQACDASAKQSVKEIDDAYVSTSRLSTKRSAKAKAQFQRENPCPVNGAKKGRCPGYDIDHIKALCAGGPDVPGNMQWIGLEAHREKTRRDLFECRTLRNARKARTP